MTLEHNIKPELPEPGIKFSPEELTRLAEQEFKIETIPASITIPGVQLFGRFRFYFHSHDVASRQETMEEWQALVAFDPNKTLQVAWKPDFIAGSFNDVFRRVKVGHWPLRRTEIKTIPAKPFAEQQLVVERFSQEMDVNSIIPSAEQLLYLLYYHYWDYLDSGRGDESPFGKFSRTTNTFKTINYESPPETRYLTVGLGTDWGVDSLECGWWMDDRDYRVGVMPLIFPRN